VGALVGVVGVFHPHTPTPSLLASYVTPIK
jgi:hypothetical protein